MWGRAMKLFLIYDIEDDGTRGKVADTCQNYGLTRVQYSTFFGDLTRNRQEELALRLRRLIGRRRAYVLVVPICERDMATMQEIGAPLCRLPLLT